MKSFTLSRRKIAVAVLLCAIFVGSSVAFWQMNQNAQAAIIDPHPGLVGWWKFDEGTGTVASDSSGNGNDGTVYGANWVTGTNGQALSFNGISDYVDCGNSSTFNLTSAFTIMAWVKINNINPEEEILSKQHTSYELKLYGGRFGFECYVGASNVFATANDIVPTTNQWYFVVWTYDSTTHHLYVNGVDQVLTFGSGSGVTGPIRTNALNLTIGRRPNDDLYWDGTIDEVRIYNRALSSDEIQADYQIGPDFPSTILAKVPKGTTQVIATLSWQGTGSINVTITSPSQSYTEDMIPVYQKTTYSTSGGDANMLNIKRLSVSVDALLSDQNWYVSLAFDNVMAYQMSVEIQK